LRLIKVEKGKLFERIGRKVMGLKSKDYGRQTATFFYFAQTLPAFSAYKQESR